MEVLATQDDDQEYHVAIFVLIETLAIQMFLFVFIGPKSDHCTMLVTH